MSGRNLKVKKPKLGFDVIIAKTLHELVEDLKQIAPKKSEKCRKAMEGREDVYLISDLQNYKSPVYKSVLSCKELLENDSRGRKYLSIFAMIESSLTPTDIDTLAQWKKQKETKASPPIQEEKEKIPLNRFSCNWVTICQRN